MLTAIGSLVTLGLILGWLGWAEVTAPASLWSQLLGNACGMALGLLFVGVGTRILAGTRLATLDRARGEVNVRSGWLAWRCQRLPLCDFHKVVVLPRNRESNRTARDDEFDVALMGEAGSYVVVGTVTRSAPLARIVADEVAQFLGIP